LCASLAALAGCGGSPAGPTPATPPPLFTVEALVFHDENSNGLQDGNEGAVVPGAEVLIAGRAARAGAGGRVTVNNVPPGVATASLAPESLPPYYLSGAPVEVNVPLPAGEVVRLGARLPIGDNRVGTYMAFGDSITVGDGSSDRRGYRPRLEGLLTAHFARDAEVFDRGIGGTRSNEGAARIGLTLRRADPAYTLILYGTNDWNAGECRGVPDPPCFTLDSLRRIVQAVKGTQSLPVLGTVIPANTGFDGRAPESRNVWVAAINDRVRAMAAEEDVRVADLHQAFLTRVPDFRTLFVDHVHPNDEGYAIMADTWFEAITTRPMGGGLSLPVFGFQPAQP
jgi:lysophospholipase L1-like esterase